MCKYGPRFFVGYKFLATCKKSERQRQRDDKQNYTFQGATTLHPGPIKQAEIIIVPEETVFMQTLALLPLTPIIFRFKLFGTEVRAFLSSCPELKFTYKC